MFLFAVPPVDHAQAGHAQGGAVFVDGNRVRDGIGPAAVGVEINKRLEFPFLAERVGGIVVMCRVQAEIFDRDIRIYGLKFPEGDDGAYAVMPPGVQETDMYRQVNPEISIV